MSLRVSRPTARTTVSKTVNGGSNPSGLAIILPPGLDKRIAPIVRLLAENGVETFESCEGGPGHAFFEPTVRFYGGRPEGFRALSVALQHGLKVCELRRYWRIEDGEPVGPSWEMTFLLRGDRGRT